MIKTNHLITFALASIFAIAPATFGANEKKPGDRTTSESTNASTTTRAMNHHHHRHHRHGHKSKKHGRHVPKSKSLSKLSY